MIPKIKAKSTECNFALVEKTIAELNFFLKYPL